MDGGAARPLRRERAEDLVEETRVHSAVYTNPLVFAGELERIFYRSWVYVAHESEIREPGDYKTTSIGLQPVIVDRDADTGEVQVLFNRCRHRGSVVCEADRGHATFFRCPYHGWTYSNNGTLVGVPFSAGSDVDKGRLGLVHVARVDSYKGFVFASLSDSGPELAEHLGNARPFLDRIAESPFVVASPYREEYAGNWKLQQENTVDDYHASALHRVYFDILTKRTGKRPVVSTEPAWRSRDLGGGHSVLDFRGGATSSSLSAREFNLQVFPNLGYVAFQLRVTLPFAVDRTRVDSYPMLPVGDGEEAVQRRLREIEDFYGPAGLGRPDDLEVAMRRCTTGLAADRGNPWLELSRGVDRAEVDEETGIISGHITDEFPQRAIYRQWRLAMEGWEVG